MTKPFAALRKAQNNREMQRARNKAMRYSGEPFLGPSELENSIPVCIRPNKIVRLVNLPADLTKQEADRLANIVMSFARIEQPVVDLPDFLGAIK